MEATTDFHIGLNMSSTNVDMACAVLIPQDNYYFVSNQIDNCLRHLDIDENGHEFARVRR